MTILENLSPSATRWVRTALAMIGAGIVLPSQVSAQGVRTCLAVDATVNLVKSQIEDLATNPSFASLRSHLGMSSSDVISVVQTNSICDAVTTAVAGASRVEAFIVIKSASTVPLYFAAERHADQFGPIFVVDTAMNRRLTIGAEGPLDNATTAPSGVVGPQLNRAAWTLSASSTWNAISITDAIDGQNGSRWTSGQTVQTGSTYFVVDTHAAVTVGSLRIDDRQFAADLPITGDIYSSTDGSTYSLLSHWTAANIEGGVLDVSWSPTEQSSLKLVATGTPNVSTNWFSIGEISIFASLPSTLWTFSASETWSGASILDAADGSNYSRWTSGTSVTPGATKFQINTHTISSIGAVRINDSQFQGDVPATGEVYVSLDGLTYSRVAQWTAGNVTGGVLTLTWTPVNARYIKVVATSTPATNSNWFSIGEIELFPTVP
ncbi:MAG: hypothetical protein JWM95_1295 [Gemmatimonadetes bacterium]|nr:hypothetical protein [Gemmatimonadota bacterium]